MLSLPMDGLHRSATLLAPGPCGSSGPRREPRRPPPPAPRPPARGTSTGAASPGEGPKHRRRDPLAKRRNEHCHDNTKHQIVFVVVWTVLSLGLCPYSALLEKWSMRFPPTVILKCMTLKRKRQIMLMKSNLWPNDDKWMTT